MPLREMMKSGKASRSSLKTSVIGLATALLLSAAWCEAADITLVCSVGVRPVVDQLLPRYEHASGHQVHVQFGTAAQLKAKIDAGERFDVAILGAAQVDDLVKRGRGSQASRIDVARAGLGFAIRADRAKPDLDSEEGVKRYLRGAKTISSGNPANGGFGATYFDHLVQRLGIADETRPKMRFSPPGAFAKAVASGEAEAGVGLLSEIASVPGVQAVSLMKDDPASYLRFAAVVASDTPEPHAARALLEFLGSRAARDLFRSEGMVPQGAEASGARERR